MLSQPFNWAQLIWSAPLHGWSTMQRGLGQAVEKARALCLKHRQPVLSMRPPHSSWAWGNIHLPCPWCTEHLLGLLQHWFHLTVILCYDSSKRRLLNWGFVLAKTTGNWCITNSKNEQSWLTLPKQNFKMVELSSSKATNTLLERCL